MNMGKIKTWLKEYWWTILISILIGSTLILMTISIYYFWKKFHDNNISESPQDWGVFGDYFGGVLNPLLSLINICITIWLTVIINRFSQKNNDSQIDSARKIALIELKHEALKELRLKLNGHFEEWRKNYSNRTPIYNCSATIREFNSNYNYLFQFEHDYFYQFQFILSDAASTISETPKDTIKIISNFGGADIQREELLADIGKRTIM